METAPHTEKELVKIISGLVEKYENEKRSARDFIHAEIGPLLGVVKMTLSKHFKTPENLQIMEEVFTHMDDCWYGLKDLADGLYPSMLDLVSVPFTIENYNHEQKGLKQVEVNFENASKSFREIEFDQKDGICIFRIYSNIITYYRDTLNSKRIAVKVFDDGSQFTMDFINEDLSKLDKPANQLHVDMKINDAFVLALGGFVAKKSDFLKIIRVNIPMKIPLN